MATENTFIENKAAKTTAKKTTTKKTKARAVKTVEAIKVVIPRNPKKAYELGLLMAQYQ